MSFSEDKKLERMIEKFFEEKSISLALPGIWEGLDRLLEGWLVSCERAYSAPTFASRAMAILLLSSLKSKDLIT